MNSTVELLWSLHTRQESSVGEWAKAMVESGCASDAMLRLMYEPIEVTNRDRLLKVALSEIGLGHLLDIHKLKLEYERESIGDYFENRIDGWTLMRRCCALHWMDQNDDPDRVFWVAVAEDADFHGGNGMCIDYDFRGIEFDVALKMRFLGREDLFREVFQNVEMSEPSALAAGKRSGGGK